MSYFDTRIRFTDATNDRCSLEHQGDNDFAVLRKDLNSEAIMLRVDDIDELIRVLREIRTAIHRAKQVKA